MTPNQQNILNVRRMIWLEKQAFDKKEPTPAEAFEAGFRAALTQVKPVLDGVDEQLKA